MQRVQLPVLSSATQDSTSNAAQNLVVAAIANQRIIVTQVEIGTSGAAVGATALAITVKDGATVKYKTYIAAAAAIGTQKVISFGAGLALTVNSALTVTVAAVGTASGITTANALYYVE